MKLNILNVHGCLIIQALQFVAIEARPAGF